VTSPDEIERVLRSLYADVWTDRRYEVAEALFHPEFSSPGAPGMFGAEAKLHSIRRYHAAVPDLVVTIDDLVVAADRAVVRFTFAGTDLGGLAGHEPTGRPLSMWGVEFHDFRDGRIISGWVGVDWLGTFVQIGTLPDPWNH